MAEYYIREAESDEARGPFDENRIADLVEAGRASADTLYYDDEREDWFPLSENETFDEVFNPSVKRVQLKAKEAGTGRGYEEEARPPVTVDEMLAAAEGKSEDTRHLKVKEKRAAQAAGISLPVLGIMMLLAAFVNLYPHLDVISVIRTDKEWGLLLQYPMIIVGLFDLFLMLCCFLSVTDAFPLLRFRAMIGLGYFTYIFWSWGELPQALAVAIGSLSIYICTVTLNLYVMILFSVLGIIGMGSLAVMSFM